MIAVYARSIFVWLSVLFLGLEQKLYHNHCLHNKVSQMSKAHLECVKNVKIYRFVGSDRYD